VVFALAQIWILWLIMVALVLFAAPAVGVATTRSFVFSNVGELTGVTAALPDGGARELAPGRWCLTCGGCFTSRRSSGGAR